MKSLSVLTAVVIASTSVGTAFATPPKETEASKLQWQKLIKIIQALKKNPRPKTPNENVSCTGPNGTTITYRTSSEGGRSLVSPVSIVSGGARQTFQPSQIGAYLNVDDQVVMKAIAARSQVPSFSLHLGLTDTVTPAMDQVATYQGTITASFGNGAGTAKDVSCSVTRLGFGTLPNPVPSGNRSVKCYISGTDAAASTVALISLDVARNPSSRLISDLQEVRSPTDTETLPSFLVSQFSYDASRLYAEVDDGSPDGRRIARLSARGERLLANSADNAGLVGSWTGTYERFDDGRQLRNDVDCYVTYPVLPAS